MLKPKTYNFADSNIANLGSDLDHKVKQASANTEPAWAHAGQAEGLEIWRIEHFNVRSWPKAEYGKFYRGDSYIVLRTYKKGDSLAWDIHFWLGETTTQDEAGTAAYKTVELDEKLGGGPVQHREACGAESSQFLSYFPGGLHILEGGVESGFHHVGPENYQPRLLQIKGDRKHLRVHQVDLSKSALNSGDAFVLDNGLTVYQWSGSSAGIWEKNQAGTLARALDDERHGKVNHFVVSENEHTPDLEAFYALLGPGQIKSAQEGGDDSQGSEPKRLFKVSDAGGKLDFSEVAHANRHSLDTNDVFLYDVGAELFVWIGRHANAQEKKDAMNAAHEYIHHFNRPEHLAIAIIPEGGENEFFEAFWH